MISRFPTEVDAVTPASRFYGVAPTVTLPEKCVTIEDVLKGEEEEETEEEGTDDTGAFSGCVRLVTDAIPQSCTHIGNLARGGPSRHSAEQWKCS
jgi:hypothetical protein